jgi:MFS family permease
MSTNSPKTLFCSPNSTNVLPKKCEFHEDSHTMRSLMLIFFSFFVSGLGISVIQPLGLSYYDDNVPPRQAPLFHGVLSVAKVMGPFLGYILGSLCLRLYENPFNPPPEVKLGDPRWVGAWWLGEFVMVIVSSYH